MYILKSFRTVSGILINTSSSSPLITIYPLAFIILTLRPPKSSLPFFHPHYFFEKPSGDLLNVPLKQSLFTPRPYYYSFSASHDSGPPPWRETTCLCDVIQLTTSLLHAQVNNSRCASFFRPAVCRLEYVCVCVCFEPSSLQFTNSSSASRHSAIAKKRRRARNFAIVCFCLCV